MSATGSIYIASPKVARIHASPARTIALQSVSFTVPASVTIEHKHDGPGVSVSLTFETHDEVLAYAQSLIDAAAAALLTASQDVTSRHQTSIARTSLLSGGVVW